MTVSVDALLSTATKLHAYLVQRHWTGKALIGPDAGIRLNARIGRFVKSYLNWLPWYDDLYYMQAQGYWTMDNWLLSDITGEERYGAMARACSEGVLQAQFPDGHWEYPNREWRGRIATVEGCFGAISLLETYARTHEKAFLDGAVKWYRFMIEEVGYQREEDYLAINYFSNVPGSRVPNNTTLALRTLAQLYAVTEDKEYLRDCSAMVAWLTKVQLPSGELPYAVGSRTGPDRPHFLCFQYNAFEFMDLVSYRRMAGDESILPVLTRLAPYLSDGILPNGAAVYDCSHRTPEVAYYGAALAAALSRATLMGLGEYRELAERAYQRVLSQQRADGGLSYFSRGNYQVLTDRRSYPRYLSMVLNSLLLEVQTRVGWPTTQVDRTPVLIDQRLEGQA
ncbi:MAG: beta-L-arabinofuranosidase domain-containing protein [Anaerolineae bacterium]